MRSRASWFRELLIRLRPARRRDRIEREIDEELRFHIDHQVDDNVEQGMTPRQARRAALRRFGDPDDARNGCRTIQMASLKPRARGGLIEAVLHDLRHGARSLARRPGFAVAAVLTLALGIGANAAMFSVIETVVLAPLPFESPDRVVQVWNNNRGNGAERQMSEPNFRDYENLNDVFSHVAALRKGDGLYVEHEDGVSRVRTLYASADLFDMMGVVPTSGRTFRAEEDFEGVGNIVLLTHAYWLRNFGGEAVIGRTIRVRRIVVRPETEWYGDYETAEYEIVGMLPPDFRVPPLRMEGGWGSSVERVFGYGAPVDPEIVLPLGLETLGRGDRNHFTLRTLAQLRDGVTAEQARANLQSIAAGIVETVATPGLVRRGLEVTVVPVGELLRQEYGVALGFLWAATALVLLVACASVSSLLLGWGVAREQELALRAALGAGARRIFSQLISESMVIAGAASVLGVLLAYWGIAAIKMLAPAGVHRLDDVGLDLDVFGFTIGVSLLTVMLVGLWPALRGARRHSSEVLKAGGRGATLARTRSLRVLVTAEVALSLVLLAGAGLMLQSFWNLVGVDTGVGDERVVQVNTRSTPQEWWNLPLNSSEGPGPQRARLIRERVEAIPGVTSLAWADRMGVPLTGFELVGYHITIPGRPRPGETAIRVDDKYVSGGFFRTLGIELVAGRTWDERWWKTQWVRRTFFEVVISEGMARTFWPDENPVGNIFYHGSYDPDVANQTLGAWRRWEPGDERPDGPKPLEVIGVVRDVRNTLEREPIPTFYYGPWGQADNFFVRTSVDPAGLAAVLRREIEAVDPGNIEVWQIRTIEQMVAERSADSRFRALLVVLFAVVATGITCLGLFGVLTYAVAQRTRELGIRVALGAGNSHIAGLVLSQGARMAGLGVALGLVLVFWVTRYISSLLFGVVPLDPMTLVGVAALIFALALLAAYLPARRAMRVDPITALRH